MKKSKFAMSVLAAAMFATVAAGLGACSKGGTNNGKPNTDPDPGPSGKSYTITLDANGGTLAGASTVVTGTDGKIPAASFPADPTHATDTFGGWWTSATGGNRVDYTYAFSADSTIWAHWTAGGGNGGGNENPTGVYTITFHAGDGAFASGETGVRQTMDGVLVGGIPTVTPPENKKLSGWYTAATGGDHINVAAHTFTVDTELYAQYEDDNGGGEVSGESVSIRYSDGVVKFTCVDMPDNTGVNIYAWDGDENYYTSAWPGTAMDGSQTVVEGFSSLSASNITHYIINFSTNGEDTNQTNDGAFSFSGGHEYIFTFDGWIDGEWGKFKVKVTEKAL